MAWVFEVLIFYFVLQKLIGYGKYDSIWNKMKIICGVHKNIPCSAYTKGHKCSKELKRTRLAYLIGHFYAILGDPEWVHDS